LQTLNFQNIAIITAIFWLVGLVIFYGSKKSSIKNIGNILLILGTLIIAGYIALIWINLGRAPLRTLGETRLWYTFFVPATGIFLYYRWKIGWIYAYSIFLAFVFLLVNYFNPENFDKTLMPALQSYWFVPHVVVYIFAYSILGSAMLVSIMSLYSIYVRKTENTNIIQADNLVYLGFAFLSFGLIFGALWAKEAWGHYWTWDPKETWALITWLFYLTYIHIRYYNKQNITLPLWLLSISFFILLICWFGINYLPSAENSVHTYSQ